MERGRKRKFSQDGSGSSLQSTVPGSRPAPLENIQCKKARTDSDTKSSPSRTVGRERRSVTTIGSSTSNSSSSSSNNAIRKNRLDTGTTNSTPGTSNTSSASNNSVPRNKPTTSNTATTSNKATISISPITNSKPTISTNPTISNKPSTNNKHSTSNTSSTSNKPSTSSKPTVSNSKRELKNLQDAWSSEVSPFRTRSHREEHVTPSKKSRREIQFPDAETMTSSSSTSSGSGVGSSASSYSNTNSKTDSSSFLSSNSGSYTSGETGSSTTGYTYSSTGLYTASGESGTSDSPQASTEKQNLPGTSGTKTLSKINKFSSAIRGSKYSTSSSSNEDQKATQTKSPKNVRPRKLSSQSSDYDPKQNVPCPTINTREHSKYSDSANESYSSNMNDTTPIKRCVGRPRTRHLSSSSKAKERESSSQSMSPLPKVVRSPQDIRSRTGDKTLRVPSNESTSTGDSELIRTYITKISNQTPPKHLRNRDGAVATTSNATSIDGFCPEDRQATHPDICSSKTMTPSPIRQTRSRSKSGDAAVDDNGVNAPLKRKSSRLMAILTSEHDYSQSSPHELKGDKVLPSSLKENISARNINLQKTVLTKESGIVGGTEPGTSNTKVSNTDSTSLHIITSQESSNMTSLSSTSVQDEDKTIGYDLNDFVIRRRKLRSESQQDELWEGLPSVTPFRKHPSKLKDENEVYVGDGVPAVTNPSSEPASSSSESLQERTSSSTIGLISEIDSILTDTESSSCQGHVSFEDVPSHEEATPDCSTCDASGVEAGASEEEAGVSSLQRVLDYDLEAVANNSLSELSENGKSMFSNDISSCASTFISRDFTSPNEHQYCTDGSFSMKPGSRSSDQLIFRSAPGTPMPSGPESVWWSDKANSEGWATPVADPLAISPLATNSQSSDLETLPTSDQGLENNCIPQDECDSLSNSCDAVDVQVFKEVTERKGTSGQVEISAEVMNSNMTALANDIQVTTSSDTNTSVSFTEDGDPRTSPVRFMVTRSDCANIDSDTARKTDEQVMQHTSSEPPKPESSSSSGEFLLWSKKKDKRKISFPKIVLRKCKESSLRAKERHSPQPKDNGGEKPQSMSEKHESTTTSECPSSGSTSLTPMKRSVRLMKKVDTSASGQCGRSGDFVYTPLKRDDNKTKTRTSTDSPSPSVRRKSNSDICQGEEEEGAGPSTDRNISDIDMAVLSPRQLRMLEREGREVTQTDSNHGLPLKARWKKKVKRNTSGVLKKNSGTSFDQRERLELQQTPSSLPPRRKKGPNIDEELLANPVLDKHACVLWSSEHRRHFQMSHPDASSAALDELLRRQWSQELTAQEKMKYFIRARDAVRDEDKHQPRSSRGDTLKRGGRPGSGQKSTEEEDEKSSLEQFTRLKTKRQKDLLTKWLHFFQKVLSRQDYAKFIEEVKEGILEAEAQNKPNKTRGLTSKIFSHKKLLFLKMNSLKGHVMAQYHRRKRRLKDLNKLAFYILVTRLIQGKPCSFIKGCRSKRLTGVLQDLKDLEYGDSIAVLGYPIPTNSFTNLYKEIVETVDSCMFREEPDADDLGNPLTVAEDVSCNGRDDADGKIETVTNSVLSKTCVEKKNAVSLLQKHPVVQEPEWYERPVSEQFMNRTVNELKNVTIFPQLHPQTLDSVFLPPPFRMPVCGAPAVGRSLLQRAQCQVQYRCVASPWMSGCRPAVSTTPRAHSSHQSVREVLYADARDAFQRSYASNTDPCCEMDSPSCVLSTWLVADKIRK
ncbi:serine-rich adhesin for platelets-like [Haliotis asinina]|uniref:serine-rich adhesin for platelets-like n=1 Tax=Haliotis asinina TaxID=109174 RepID=UPI003531C69F